MTGVVRKGHRTIRRRSLPLYLQQAIRMRRRVDHDMALWLADLPAPIVSWHYQRDPETPVPPFEPIDLKLARPMTTCELLVLLGRVDDPQECDPTVSA